MSALVPCPSCARHVRADETACPFCSTVLPETISSNAVPGTTKRLSRIAAFTFATAVAVTGAMTVGCSGSDDGTGQSEGELGGMMPMYGAPVPHHDAGPGCEDQKEEIDPGTIVAMYGMPWPEPVDAGAPCKKDSGAPHATDAGHPTWPTYDGGGFHAMYGLPPGDDFN